MSEQPPFMLYVNGLPPEPGQDTKADMYPTLWIVSTLQKCTLDWKEKKNEKIENESAVVTAT